MTDADMRQVGGDHYKKFGTYQPWKVMEQWLTKEQFEGFLLGSAIAYLARYNTKKEGKGGHQDIQKAIHYMQKLVATNVSHEHE